MKVLLAVLLLASFVSAQSQMPETDAEKQKKAKEMDEKVVQMLERIVADAPTLKLAQNRAIVYGMAADLYWKFDEKRAREILHNCTGEILTANVDWEKDQQSNDNPLATAFNFPTLRYEVLPLVAAHDADLALEMLLQTRPPALADAILKASAPGTKSSDAGFSPDRQAVRMELDLEQRFALLAADSDPDKAIKLIKDSLAKGISWNVLPMLQKLNKKDEKKAADLAGDVVAKIVDTDLTKKGDDLNAAVSLLQYAANVSTPARAREKLFRFSDTQIKDLANKLAATFMQPGLSTSVLQSASRALPNLEKVVPERTAILRTRLADATKNLPAEFRGMQASQRMWDPNTQPEDIIAQIPKLDDFGKLNANSMLPGKIAQIDDEARARKLIAAIPDEQTRGRALDQYEASKIGRASRDGRLDEARKMIGNLRQRKDQVRQLVALAVDFQKRGGEKDLETAASLMKDAKALVSEYPEDGDELTDLLEVVRGYAIVEPSEGFRLFEPVVDQINDVVQATAVLSKYDKRNQGFRKGELVFKVNSSPSDNMILFRCIVQMQLLAKSDLERMTLLSDRLLRSDSRIISKLYVARGFLQQDNGQASGMGAGAGAVVFSN